MASLKERLDNAFSLVRAMAGKDGQPITEGVGWISDGNVLLADSTALDGRVPKQIHDHIAAATRTADMLLANLRKFAVKATSRWPGSPHVYANLRPVVFGPVSVNPRLLYLAISAAEPGTVSVAVGRHWKRPLVLRGSDWTAVLMGMSHDVGAGRRIALTDAAFATHAEAAHG